jgi:2,4-diaminopentanoate dehydrogenase
VPVLAVGANPGFAMDMLPLVLSAAQSHTTSVHVERVFDAAKRRASFTERLGIGADRKAAKTLQSDDLFGHIGLHESCWIIAAGLGFTLDDVTTTKKFLFAKKKTKSGRITVEKDCVIGAEQRAKGILSSAVVVELVWRTTVGESDPHDTIVLKGNPNLSLRADGIHGDAATRALAIHATSTVRQLEPGVRTLLDVFRLRGRGKLTG